MSIEPVVHVVDGDLPTCDLIRQLTAMMHLRCEVFACGQAFLNALDRSECGCVLTELNGLGVNGFHIQQQLAAAGITMPVIFLAFQAKLPVAVRAMRAGAFHFLEKPIHEQEVWDAIQEAVALDQANRETACRESALKERLETLTLKEEHVLRMIADGKSSREIAKELELSIRTIEVRRNVLMKKLGVNTPDELLRFALTACDGYSWLTKRQANGSRGEAGTHAGGSVLRAPLPTAVCGER